MVIATIIAALLLLRVLGYFSRRVYRAINFAGPPILQS